MVITIIVVTIIIIVITDCTLTITFVTTKLIMSFAARYNLLPVTIGCP